jgi:predicted enzyme related to lactoylglutathione lyase
MSHRVVWFDIPVKDLQRAANFYQQVLAVSIESYGGDMPVAVMEHGPVDVAGCLFKSEDEEPSMHGPILYFAVEGRLQEATDIAAAQGGQVIQAPHSIGPHGNRSFNQGF